MYNHRSERNRVDVVDLDPYGTAAPFIDGAVQCVNDGGLSLAQSIYHTCLTVLCRLAMRHMYGHVSSGDHQLSREMVGISAYHINGKDAQFRSFSNYGGAPVKAEYCHEAVRATYLFRINVLTYFRRPCVSFSIHCLPPRQDMAAIYNPSCHYRSTSTCVFSCAYIPPPLR